ALEQLVDLLGAVKILLVPPAGYVQIGHGGNAQVGVERLAAPEEVAIGMVNEIVPGGNLAFEIFLIGIGQRAETEIPLVSVVAVELEIGVGFLGGLQQRGVFKTVAQAEGAVVMEVVAEEHVGGRGLLGNSLKRRMGVDQRHGRRPAGIGDAPHADAPIVVGNILEQPLNGVVGVGALIRALGIGGRARRALHDECPLRFESAAQVLEDEDVAVGDQLVEVSAVGPALVFGDAIRSARIEKRQRLGGGFGSKNYSLQPHA